MSSFKRRAVVTAAAGLLMGSYALAQQREEQHFEVQVAGPGSHEPALAGTFHFIGAHAGPGGKIVAGQPYTAEGVSESVQMLADGGRITRKNTVKFARDSQGRTRTEHTINAIGPWASAGNAPRIVTIVDPVARETFVLNEHDKTARKMKMPEPGAAMPKVAGGGAGAGPGAVWVERVEKAEEGGNKADVIIERFVGPGPSPAVPVIAGAHGPGMMASRVAIHDSKNMKEEPLGRQTIEGVAADGVRRTHTIPAGTIGNDRDLVTVIEQWTSSDLQVMVRSLTKDPQFGETNYRLTNIQRSEPAKSLFQVPADYTVKDAPAPHIMMRREKKQ